MQKDELFFVALKLPVEVCSEINDIRAEISNSYHCFHANKTIPHITLVPPFRTSETLLNIYKIRLKKESDSILPFKAEISGTGCFRRNHVIYLAVTLNESLNKIYTLTNKLFSEIIQPGSNIDLNFTPHITLAHRDLSKAGFQLAWKEYETLDYKRSLTINSLVIFRHNSKIWIEEP